MVPPEILVSAALLVLAVAGWLGTRREGFHVDPEPPRRNLIIHRSFHVLAGLLSAAACYWVGSTGAVAQEGELLLHTSIAGSLLPLFFLWMSLAGMLSFVLSCTWLGHLVRPVPPEARVKRLEHRLITSASRFAEEAARRKPLLEVKTFALVGLLSVLGVISAERRVVEVTVDGVEVRSFVPFLDQVAPWQAIDLLRVEQAASELPSSVAWHLQGGSWMTVRREDLWELRGAAVRQLVELHRQRGIQVSGT